MASSLEHLEVVVLLITNDIHVGIQIVVGEAALGGAQVLGDIDGGSVSAENELAVQAVGGEVAPHGAVGIFHEGAHIQALLDQFLTQKVSIVLIVHLVKGNAQSLVGLVKSLEHPAVHHGPELPYMRVSGFPVHQHLVHLVNDFRVLLFHFGIGHIAVSHQVVAFLAGAFGGGAVKQLLPGIHALADMYAAVIHQRCLDDLVAARLEDAGHAVSQKIITDMTQVKGLVRVGGRELHHNTLAGGGQLAEGFVGSHGRPISPAHCPPATGRWHCRWRREPDG